MDVNSPHYPSFRETSDSGTRLYILFVDQRRVSLNDAVPGVNYTGTYPKQNHYLHGWLHYWVP